jgi:cytochrome c oxidase cbb3-type subunit III
MRIPAAIVCCLLALNACKREQRNARPAPARVALYSSAARESPIEPGGPLPHAAISYPFAGNAYAISEGQRLFGWYNCSGCHSHGGGGIGPPLIKQEWIYGGEPENLFDTIVKGRPNGMPTWGGRIPEYQIWQIVAYVRSLNKEEPSSASPARTDEIQPSPTIRNKVPGETR